MCLCDTAVYVAAPPTYQLNERAKRAILMWLSIAHDKSIDEWITERHYLHTAPATSRYRMWFVEGSKEQFVDDTKKVGAMLWGKPSARLLDQNTLLELYRMYFIENTEKNAESKALAMARRWIRRNAPEIKGLIAYSSTGQNHTGTIYAADNWFTLGDRKDSNTKWATRFDGERSNIDLSRKLFWARSP